MEDQTKKPKKPKEPKDNTLAGRRKRALERAESAAETLRALAARERKERTKRMVELGALIGIAGLGEWDDATLLGALLALKRIEGSEPNWPDRQAAWREAGARLLAERKAARDAAKAKAKEGVRVRVEFDRVFDPKKDKATIRALREARLRWIEELGVWVGTVDLDTAYAVVSQYGGVLTPTDTPPAPTTAGDGEPEHVH